MTFIELQDEVLETTGQPARSGNAVIRTRVKLLINRAYLDVGHRFQHEEMRQEELFDTIVDEPRYNLATTNIHNIQFIRDDTNDHELRKMDPKDLNRRAADTEESYRYARFGNCLYLYPTPKAIVSIRVRSYHNLTELSADADEPVFQREWDHAILMRAQQFYFQTRPDRESQTVAARLEKTFFEYVATRLRAAVLEAEDLNTQMIPQTSF